MEITIDTPRLTHLVVIKDGNKVGLVQRINLLTLEYERLDPTSAAGLMPRRITEVADKVVIERRPAHCIESAG